MREQRTRGIRIDPSSHDKFWTRDLDFLAGVYATEDTTSASCPLQLFYGPSSNFSLLLQIHHHTNTLTESSTTTSSQATEALLRFQYDKLFFGKHSGLTEPLASPASSHSQSWNQGMLDYSIRDRNSVPALLPPHLPFEFLDRVLAVDYPFLPFLDGSHLRRITQLMLEASQHDLSLQDHAIVIAMLALGATFTEHCQWAEILFSRARGISELLNEAVSLEAVQISLIMISIIIAYLWMSANNLIRSVSIASWSAEFSILARRNCSSQGNCCRPSQGITISNSISDSISSGTKTPHLLGT
jgi:hypothetical protein